MNKKNKITIARSSAAEYLTIVAAGGNGGMEAVYADENVWLSQKMLGLLYNVETHTINYHLKKVFTDSELEEASVIRNFRITAAYEKLSTLLRELHPTDTNFNCPIKSLSRPSYTNF